jgi:ATP-dependent RNA helicase DHX37/DHR1
VTIPLAKSFPKFGEQSTIKFTRPYTTMAPFVPRQRKHRVRKRLENLGRKTQPELDPNALEILPPQRKEQEERRKALRAEIRGQQHKISSKKQKRLDKYIVILRL